MQERNENYFNIMPVLVTVMAQVCHYVLDLILSTSHTWGLISALSYLHSPDEKMESEKDGMTGQGKMLILLANWVEELEKWERQVSRCF